ncbi:MAG: hypothetical protein MHPSP_003926 [Paramarteilia canceri]
MQLSEDFHIINETDDLVNLRDIKNDKEITNIVFEEVESLENIKEKLERYHDIYRFGIVVEKNDSENLYKLKIISTFKTINKQNE